MSASLLPEDKQDLFSRLPNELLIKILKSLHSLSSLWSVTRASQIMTVIFESAAVQIFEHVMTNTVPSQIACLMRAVLRLRVSSKEHGFPRLNEAQTLVLTDSRPLEIAEFVDMASITNFLTLTQKIHALTHSCIDYYIKKCMEMRPTSLVKFGVFPGAFGPVENVREWYAQAEYLPYQPPNTGPPSWVEEQRVIRAIWRIQCYLELKIACEEGRTNWAANDLKSMRSTSLLDFYSLQDFEMEQISTVYEYIQELGERDGLHFQLPDPPAETDYIDNCAHKLSFDYRQDHFQQGAEWLDRAPMAMRWPTGMARDLKFSPHPGLTFRPYRKFGFAFWDEERMCKLGFALPHGRALLRTNEYFFVWYSVLTEEERAITT